MLLFYSFINLYLLENLTNCWRKDDHKNI